MLSTGKLCLWNLRYNSESLLVSTSKEQNSEVYIFSSQSSLIFELYISCARRYRNEHDVTDEGVRFKELLLYPQRHKVHKSKCSNWSQVNLFRILLCSHECNASNIPQCPENLQVLYPSFHLFLHLSLISCFSLSNLMYFIQLCFYIFLLIPFYLCCLWHFINSKHHFSFYFLSKLVMI